MVSVDVKYHVYFTERPSTHVSMSRARWLVECCFTSTETVGLLGMGAQNGHLIVQELCESRGGRPGLSVLTSLLVSVDVKIYCTVLRHWSQLVPNMSNDI